MLMMNAPRLCSLLTLVATLAGCGEDGDPRPEVFPVTGQLTVNGEPAAGARIVLHPASGEDFDQQGSRPFAIVNQDGSFAVTTYEEGDGAPAGDYRVGVIWIADPASTNSWDKLGHRFVNPERSDLKVTVKPEPNQLEPLKITGVRLLERRPGRAPKDIDQIEAG
jgi:hypothetical protein